MTRHLSLVRILAAVALLGVPAGTHALAQGAGVSDGTLNVALEEWSLGFSQASASAGTLTVRTRNTGTAGHNLAIEDQAGEVRYESPLLDPGQSRRARVDLSDGTYTLYCGVPGHRDAGMEATLTVGEGGGGQEPSTGGGGGSRGGYY